MFHDQYVLTKGMYLPFYSCFMSCPEPTVGISSVVSFTVQSGGSLIIFQLFRYRNLALNRFFPTFLEAGMFYTWGVSGHLPLCLYASLYVCLSPICVCP